MNEQQPNRPMDDPPPHEVSSEPELEDTMSLAELQDYIRRAWTNETYSPEFNNSHEPCRDAQHALLHVIKAAGKMAGQMEEVDHGMRRFAPVDPKYVADLVICAARMAEKLEFDLFQAVRARLEEKLPLGGAP